jgi:hypothetical protein
MRELFLDIEVGRKEMTDRIVVVLDEGKISDSALIWEATSSLQWSGPLR